MDQSAQPTSPSPQQPLSQTSPTGTDSFTLASAQPVQTSKSSNHKLLLVALLTVILGILFAGGAGYLFYKSFLSPRMILAQSIQYLMDAPSIHTKMTISLPNPSIERTDFEITYIKNLNKYSQGILTLAYQTVDHQKGTVTLKAIGNKSDFYFQPELSRYEQISDMVATQYPVMLSTKSYQLLRQILTEDTWIHLPINALQTKTSRPYPSASLWGSDFLSLFKINAYQSGYMAQGKSYDHYLVGFDRLTLLQMIDSMRTHDTTLSTAEMDTITTFIKTNPDIDKNLFDILIDSTSHHLASITLFLPTITEAELPHQATQSGILAQLIPKSTMAHQLVQFAAAQFDLPLSMQIDPPQKKVEYTDFPSNVQEEIGPLLFAVLIDTQIAGQIAPQSKFVSQSIQVKQLFSEGQYNQMLTGAQQLLSVAETSEEQGIANFWIGLAYYHLGDLVKSRASLSRAIELYPNYAPPYSTLSVVNINEGKVTEGVSLAQKCMQIDPTYPWCHNDLGIAYMSMGKKSEAISEFQKALSLDPTNTEIQKNLNLAKLGT